ncbi:MAG: dihydropteroate synthase [Bacteroidota bacterium]
MYTLNCKGRMLTIDEPVVMGIINITPDSFYSGSRQQTIDSVLFQAEKMLEEGATILDIGGQSTRPGSEQISAADEISRIKAPISALHQRFPEAFISIDTYYASVAMEAVNAGASIINDISAGTLDADMLPTVAALKVPYVLMHMQGTPQSMQVHPQYTNITKDLLAFFIQQRDRLKEYGIQEVIMDPGFGFGKTIEHNFQLLQALEVFEILQAPLLVGISRKATIWRTLQTSPEAALNGTTVLNTVALFKGAAILRVHDVKEAVESVKLMQALKMAKV